jgi:hypothetical protein
MSSDWPPGASQVRAVFNRGTGWYCQNCVAFIEPLWVRRGKTIYPACLECFLDNLILHKTDVRAAEEIKDVPLLEGAVQA